MHRTLMLIPSSTDYSGSLARWLEYVYPLEDWWLLFVLFIPGVTGGVNMYMCV